MSLATAHALWGRRAVAEALAEPWPVAPDEALCREVAWHADPPGALRAWALTLPWPAFCAVVRLITGATRTDLGVPPLDTKPLTMRVPPDIIARLDAIAGQLTADLPPAVVRPVSRAGAAREALERGLEALERELATR